MGATTYHVPVLAEPITRLLAETPEGPIVDGTLGGGGHTAALMAATPPSRRFVGVDQDPEALAAAGARLDPDRLTTVHGNFGDLPALLAPLGLGAGSLAGILLDLGVSSWQLDSAGRGFAFKHPDAPLDMRMDPTGDAPTARELVAAADEATLARILAEYGEVQGARKLARRMKEAVAAGGLNTTGDLARLVESVQKVHRGGPAARMGGRIHPATTVFQALRIAVNDELAVLDRALASAPDLLMPGGRLAVLSYHSLEDRRVKTAFREGEEGPPRPRNLPPPSDWRPSWRVVTRKAVVADEAEVAANPRARSAKLRVAERVGPGGQA